MLDGVWWRDPQKLLYSQFSGTMNLQDIKQMMELGYNLVESEGSETGVNSIIDVSRCEHYARDLMNLQAMRALSRSHSKTHWVVIIDPTPHIAVRFIGLSIIKLLRLNYAVAQTETEAMTILQRVDRASSHT